MTCAEESETLHPSTSASREDIGVGRQKKFSRRIILCPTLCSSRDQHTLDELQKKFDTTFGLNFETDDETECSCDDCHNHTCSTYGPLDGCRKVRSRD